MFSNPWSPSPTRTWSAYQSPVPGVGVGVEEAVDHGDLAGDLAGEGAAAGGVARDQRADELGTVRVPRLPVRASQDVEAGVALVGRRDLAAGVRGQGDVPAVVHLHARRCSAPPIPLPGSPGAQGQTPVDGWRVSVTAPTRVPSAARTVKSRPCASVPAGRTVSVPPVSVSTRVTVVGTSTSAARTMSPVPSSPCRGIPVSTRSR